MTGAALVAVAWAALAQGAPASTHRVQLDLGFAHWFGPTLGNPEGYSTPVIQVGVRPGLSFLEVRGRYTLSLAAPFDGAQDRPYRGFASLDVVASRALTEGNQTLEVFAGPFGLLTHAGAVSPGFGIVAGAAYLFASGLRGNHQIGVYFAGRALYWSLPGDADLRRDAQIDVGVATTLF